MKHIKLKCTYNENKGMANYIWDTYKLKERYNNFMSDKIEFEVKTS